MRVMMTLASAGFVLSLVPVPAFAAPCPFPMVQECRPQPQNRPPATPTQCRCVNPPGSPTWGGKAEIHRHNVPTVKHTKQPGPYD